ncbi:MAG: hypothetical protein ABH879_05465 [archaeon]
MKMPQEIEVWYILPAIRREIAKCLTGSFGMSQKKVAGILGVTEAAISHYKKSKRAKDVVFGEDVVAEIEKSAGRITNNTSRVICEIKRLSNLAHIKKIVCQMHKEQEGNLDSCCTCFDDCTKVIP